MNTALASREPISCTDDDGQQCFRVPLDNEGQAYALVSPASYRAVFRITGGALWFANEARRGGPRYVKVRTKGAGNNASVSRLIAGAGRNEFVYHTNGDTFDLRQANLAVRRVKPGKRTRGRIGGRG